MVDVAPIGRAPVKRTEAARGRYPKLAVGVRSNWRFRVRLPACTPFIKPASNGEKKEGEE